MVQYFEVVMLEKAFRFVESQPMKVRKKVLQNLRMAQISRNPSLFKRLSSDIWEFRTQFAGIHYRLLAFWDKTDQNKTLVIVTHGFIKKTASINRNEIEKAVKIRRSYFKLK